MPFKLFHKKEEVKADDSVKEKMYTGITPLGRDIRALLELDPASQTDKFIMANYDDVKMDESPLEEETNGLEEERTLSEAEIASEEAEEKIEEEP